MKKLITASAFLFATGLTQAQPFDFERAIGTSELDPSLGAPQIAEVQPSDRQSPVWVDEVYRGTPLGSDEDFGYRGESAPSSGDAEIAYEKWIAGTEADHTV